MAYDASLGAEEKMGSLFQPDTLVPTQYFETFRGKAHLEPEMSLMLAILEYAVASFQKHIFARDSKGKAIFHETEDWILEKNSEWIFSFENICEVLGFNPSYVRQGLLRQKEMKLAERSKSKNRRG
jgi:ribosomal protein S12 methylthiotransferase accessory factor YcaO